MLIVTNLRAMATMMAVVEAQTPETGPDRGTSKNSWVANQIGGEVNYHGASIDNGSLRLGVSVAGGALGTPCRGAFYDNDAP